MALAEGMSMNVFSRFESNMILSLSYWYHYPLLVETIIFKLSLQPLGTPAKPWVMSVRENEVVTGHAFASFSPLGVCFAVFLPGTSGKGEKGDLTSPAPKRSWFASEISGSWALWSLLVQNYSQRAEIIPGDHLYLKGEGKFSTPIDPGVFVLRFLMLSAFAIWIGYMWAWIITSPV